MTKKKRTLSNQMVTALTATAAIPALVVGGTAANADEIEDVVEDTPSIDETEQTPVMGDTSDETPDETTDDSTMDNPIQNEEDEVNNVDTEDINNSLDNGNDTSDEGDSSNDDQTEEDNDTDEKDNGDRESGNTPPEEGENPGIPELPENLDELIQIAVDAINDALANPSMESIEAAREAHNELKEIGVTLPDYDELLNELEYKLNNPDEENPSENKFPQELIDDVVNKMNATHQKPTAENIQAAREAIEALKQAGFPEEGLRELIDQLDEYENDSNSTEPEEPTPPTEPEDPSEGEGEDEDNNQDEDNDSEENENNEENSEDNGEDENGDDNETEVEIPSEEDEEKPAPPSNGNEGAGEEDSDRENTWTPTPDKPSTDVNPSEPEEEPSTDNGQTDKTDSDKDDEADEGNIFLTEDKIVITSSSAVSVMPTKDGTIVVTFDEVTNDNMATIALPLDVLGEGKVIKLKTEKGIEAVPYTILDGKIILTLHKSGELIFVDPVVNIKDMDGNQYKGYVQKLAERGIIDGEQDSFKPNAKLNRMEFATMVGKSLGINESTNNQFSDVEDGYVNALAELGVLKGKGDGSFDADGSLTRQQAFTMMGRLLESKGFEVDNSQTNLSKFKDANGVSDYAKPYVDLLTSLDIIGGDNGNIKGNEAITKGQMAKILSRTLERLELL